MLRWQGADERLCERLTARHADTPSTHGALAPGVCGVRTPPEERQLTVASTKATADERKERVGDAGAQRELYDDAE